MTLALIYTMFTLYMLFIHWVADFLFQSTWMATHKSVSSKALLLHTATYTLIMATFIAPVFLYWDLVSFFHNLIIFAWSCFFFHTIQDFFTSKMTSSRFRAGKYNGLTGAFTIIGFDQFLHYVQLFLTFYFLIIN
jgi:hypothetical protein